MQDKNRSVWHLGGWPWTCSKFFASTAYCGRAFQPRSATGRKECLYTSLLQWGILNYSGEGWLVRESNLGPLAWQVSTLPLGYSPNPNIEVVHKFAMTSNGRKCQKLILLGDPCLAPGTWRLRSHRARSMFVSPPLLSSRHWKLGALREVARDNTFMRVHNDGKTSPILF